MNDKDKKTENFVNSKDPRVSRKMNRSPSLFEHEQIVNDIMMEIIWKVFSDKEPGIVKLMKIFIFHTVANSFWVSSLEDSMIRISGLLSQCC